MLSNRNLLEVEKKIKPLEKDKSERKVEARDFNKNPKIVDVKRKKRV